MLCRKSLSLVKELIESCLVEADGSIQLHAAKVVTNVVTILLVKFIKHNQNYYLKLDVSTSIRAIHQKKREPCHQLVSSDGDRQRARAFYQMDQRGHTHPKGRTTGPELVMGWVHPWVGLGWVGSEFLNFWWVGLGWVETWLRDIFNVMKYSTVC